MKTILQTLRALGDAQSDEARIAVLADAERLECRAGQRLYNADDPLDEVYILVSGYARAYVGERGTGRTTLLLRAPAVIGDREALVDAAASESVRMVTDAQLIAVDRDAFVREWHASADLRAWLTLDVMQRYTCNLAWFAVETGSLTQRVAELVDVLEPLGMPVRVIASVLGVTMRSVFRSQARLRDSATKSRVTESLEISRQNLLTSLIPEPGNRRMQLVSA